MSLGRHSGRADEFTLTFRYSGRHDPAPMSQELLQLFPEPQPAYVDRALLIPPPLIYSNRTAWYPQPAEQDYATLRAHFDTPEDVLAVTGGELLGAQHRRGPHPGDLRAAASRASTSPRSWAASRTSGCASSASRWCAGLPPPGPRTETRENMVTIEEMVAFFAERYGPCPYPVLNHVTAEALGPGGTQPPGPGLPAAAPGDADRSAPAPGPRELLRTCPTSSWPTRWPTSGGARASPRPPTGSSGSRRPGPSTRRPCGSATAEGEDAFRGMMDRMAGVGPALRRRGSRSTSGSASVTSSRIRASRGRWSTTRGPGSCTCSGSALGDEAFFGGARAFLEAHRYEGRHHRGPPGRPGGRERPRPRAVLRALDLRHRAAASSASRRAPRRPPTATGRRSASEPQNLPGSPPPRDQGDDEGEPRGPAVELDPAGGTWTIASPEPVRDVRLNEDRAILAEPKKVRRLREAPSAVAVRPPLPLECGDPLLGRGQELLVLLEEGRSGWRARGCRRLR